MRQLPEFQRIPHHELICADITQVDFEVNQFDYVALIDVIEHLPKDVGIELVRRCLSWSRLGVLISTPNGFVEQVVYEGNPFQAHLSGWSILDLRQLGSATVRGGGGPKFLRSSVIDPDNAYTAHTMRFRPRTIWAVISGFLQIFTYWTPRLAFQLHALVRTESDSAPGA